MIITALFNNTFVRAFDDMFSTNTCHMTILQLRKHSFCGKSASMIVICRYTVIGLVFEFFYHNFFDILLTDRYLKCMHRRHLEEWFHRP